jgi:hypothetical protein
MRRKSIMANHCWLKMPYHKSYSNGQLRRYFNPLESLLYHIDECYLIVESTIDIVLMFLLPKYVAEILKSPVHRRVVFAAFSGTAWILVVNTAFTIAYLHQPLLSRTVIIWLANLSVRILCILQQYHS